MHRSSRFSKSLGSPAERGGTIAVGCSPCGSQRAVAAPRSNAACLGRRGQEAVAARQLLQGEHGLLAKVSAASSCVTAQAQPVARADGFAAAQLQRSASRATRGSEYPARL